MRKHRKSGIALLCAVLVLALCVGGAAVYAADDYPAEAAAFAAMVPGEHVAVQETPDGIAFIPDEPLAGFIFYPGGKVEHAAYAPLMRALAENGVLCVLVDMPLRLAVLDMNAADGIAGQYPQITRWSIGGHSLGGAMAASYAAKHAEDYAALVLLAAYSTAELPESLSAVSVYGDVDGVMNREKYGEWRANLPENTAEVVIPGGNHAQFGDYGAQKGDGVATISPEDQLDQTLQAILPVLLGEAQST